MGLERFLISSSILGVLAQRLIRKLCDSCKNEDTLAESHVMDFNIPTDVKIYKAQGCKHCNFTGYEGRVAIAELFIIDDDVKKALHKDVDDEELMSIATKNGMIPLSHQIKDMIIQGQTSLDEALRIGIK